MSAVSPPASHSAPLRADARVIGVVTLAHSLSHFNQLVIAPLFLLMKSDTGLSFTELGFVMTMMYVVSAAMQTPTGFLVDRIGGRMVLIWGVAIQSLGTLLIGIAPNYWTLIVAAMISGAGNAVFHPADYAILNARVSTSRLGYAFSIHGMGGSLGWAMAPFFSLAVAEFYGWRGALVGAGLLGVVVTGILLSQRDIDTAGSMREAAPKPGAKDSIVVGWSVLLSLPVLMSFLFFMFKAWGVIGLQNFTIPAARQMLEMPKLAAASALTAFLIASGAGMIAGGYLVSRTTRHGTTSAVGLILASLFMLLVGFGTMPAVMVPVMLALSGFMLGVVSPARDMIVRDIAPVQARGKVYGFVYTGMDVGSMFSPLIFGWYLDHSMPQMLFYGVALVWVLGLATLWHVSRGSLARAAA